VVAKRLKTPAYERLRIWIEERRSLSGRLPRRYPSIEEALQRMMQENPHLSAERARHLTVHGVSQNEDGSYSWKFDNYLRVFPPVDISQQDKEQIWQRVTCPTLLVYGKQSWASDPAEDGRAAHFRDARVSLYDNAGHWVHHDRHDDFLAEVTAFLGED
jgi:pimeloyl-ACP methyl ester carboxylesterase